MTTGRSRCTEQALHLESSDHVWMIGFILGQYRRIKHAQPTCKYDRANLKVDNLILLFVIDRTCITDLLADAALPFRQIQTVFGIDGCCSRHRLRKRNIDRLSLDSPRIILG